MYSSLIGFSAGLLTFLGGMYLLRSGLKQVAGPKLQMILYKATATPLLGAATGALVTAFLQSSSAITVITIGLVDVGIISFHQSLGVILGTNVGTTVTAQLIAFDLAKYGWPIVLAGCTLAITGSKKVNPWAISLTGFGMVFVGLSLMSSAFTPLKNNIAFIQFLASVNEGYFLGIAAGTAVTALFQSSSAFMGVVIALALQDLVTLPGAIALMLGSNIGTCITGVLAAVGGKPAAKKVALAHVLLNVLGVIAIYPIINQFTALVAITSPVLPRQVANAHTLFNLLCSLAALPLVPVFAQLIDWLVAET